MKRILFLAGLLLSSMTLTKAQISTVIFADDFEAASPYTIGNWETDSFGNISGFPFNWFYVRADCPINLINGTKSMQIVSIDNVAAYQNVSLASCNYSNKRSSAQFIPLVYKKIEAHAYKDLKLSYKWKCGGQPGFDYGELMYSLNGNDWYSLKKDLNAGNANTQTVIDYILPEELNYKTFYIGWRFIHNITVTGQPGFTIDDIVITGTNPVTVPDCTSITYPVAGGSINAGLQIITWNQVERASGYKVTVGTAFGASDIYNNTVSTFSQEVNLPSKNTSYYIKVVPTNLVGDAVGCQSNIVTTNNSYNYCTAPILDNRFEKIANVNFADINNTSTSTNSTYQDYISVIGNVEKEGTYTFTATAVNGLSYDGDQIIVWIDFNQNGILDDAGERVLITDPGKEATWTGSITIPADAKQGTTRMRVRLNDTSSELPSDIPCGTSVYGQIQDFTLNIKEKIMDTSNNNRVGISVYPNPFKNILSISNTDNVKSISIIDIAGRVVKTIGKASKDINLSELKSGLYLVNLHYNDGSMRTLKAIKK